MSEMNKVSVCEITHKELVEVIERSYEAKGSLFVQGKIGIGKSDSTRQACRNLALKHKMEFIETKSPNEHPDKFVLCDIRLAQKDAGEILGLPETYVLLSTKIDEDRERLELIPLKIYTDMTTKKDARIVDYCTKWSMPSWYPRQGRGIIFIDEFNLAPPLVQYAMYELINDRCLGDYTLPDGWSIVGAGNRGTIDGSPVFDFPAPLNNRFMWYELKQPALEEWTEWAMNNGIDYRIITFLQTKRSALYTFDYKHKEKAFATPRSWTKASKMIKDIDDERKIDLFISGVIGTYLAGEFKAFLQARRQLPPTEKYIKDPYNIAIPEKDDLLYTLCCNLVEYFIAKKDKKTEGVETLRSITVIADRLWKHQKKMEFTVFLLKLIKISDQKFFATNIIGLKEFTDLAVPIKKYLF